MRQTGLWGSLIRLSFPSAVVVSIATGWLEPRGVTWWLAAIVFSGAVVLSDRVKQTRGLLLFEGLLAGMSVIALAPVGVFWLLPWMWLADVGRRLVPARRKEPRQVPPPPPEDPSAMHR